MTVILTTLHFPRNPSYLPCRQNFKRSTTNLGVDATHGTNAYGFKLITVMVMDEFGEGELYNVIYAILHVYMYMTCKSFLK